MTFDVGQLPARAADLKEAGVRAAYRELTRFGAGGGGGAAQMMQIAEDSMAGVENVYDRFLDVPDPADFAPKVEWLGNAMAKLATEGHTSDPVTGSTAVSGHNPNLTLVGGSGDYLSDWTGVAADSYKRGYGDRFAPTASSQYAAVSVLRNAINAEAAVWQGVREDLDKLSQEAIELMEGAGSKGGAEWAAVLSITATVITVPLTGGASAIALPAVAAGLSVASTGIGLATGGGGEPTELGLDAGSSDKVISSLQTALTKLAEEIGAQELKISEALNQSSGVLDSQWDVFCLPQPALVDAPNHPVNDPSYSGHSA
ncbi:hypothetical protein [Nocardioides deserti]|uniref:ESX-1 secretion-associated protein EspA/EspE-like domain-containing protein n=1 Tax=Nocardioides deserti TaxID=1588644 RepID=A0ABR6U895_9ACTN|nr:hypothetical protein [Nocardioides deserti]MBC2960664.1 hypothetical protein [Nocardioides deserti]GGO78663.1 hypothetical protein GCM10012276_36570 [Nocardioides deserti]